MPKPNPKPKRAIASALEESTIPPPSLKPSQTIAKLLKAEGNHLYSVILPREFVAGNTSPDQSEDPSQGQPQNQAGSPPGNPSSNEQPGADTTIEKAGISPSSGSVNQSESCLVELVSTLRGAVFFRRNGYVLVDTDRELLGGRVNKISGIVVGVVLGGREEKEWRAMRYWPEEFGRDRGWGVDGDDDGPEMPDEDD